MKRILLLLAIIPFLVTAQENPVNTSDPRANNKGKNLG